MKEDCKNHFDKIIKEYEDTVEYNYVIKTKKLKTLIKQFIIDNNLILYGGSAIDLLLPKDKKIYKKDEKLFDYDVYSDDAYNMGVKLVDLLVKHKYKYVQLREAAFTQTTFKIFLENLPIFDITNLPKGNFSIYRKFTKCKQKMLVIGPEILIRDMCAQLSQPHISYFRLEKTYKRYNLFNDVYGITKCNKVTLISPTTQENKILIDLLKLCKTNKYPLLGYYALQLLNDKKEFYTVNNINSFLSFFTKDIDNVILHLKKSYDITVKKNENYTTILYNNNKICDIYDSSELCVSFCNKKGYNILTIFGIKYFIYNDLIYKDKITDFDKYILTTINKYIKLNNCKDQCKINMKCYGDGKPPGWQIIKSRWDHGIVKYKPSTDNKLNTFFNK